MGAPGPDPGGDSDRGSNRRVSLAAVIAVRDGQQPRLIYPVMAGHIIITARQAS